MKDKIAKKIGICACYDSRNYGSMLQAFATQVVIENLGYESEYIVYRKKKDFIFILNQIPRLFNKNLMFDKLMFLKKKISISFQPDIKSQEAIREKAFCRFKNNYYRHFSKEYYGYDALSEAAKQYDTIVVGSDQLWTPGGLATNFYNLMFVPDEVNKVSYATSFGVGKIPRHQHRKTKEYLSRINHLSVREIKGAEIVKSIADLNAEVVADPTLLLKDNEWLELIPNRSITETGYIFCYFLGENPKHRKIANQLKEKTGLKIVTTPFLDSFVKEDLNFGDEKLFDVGPDDFVNLIRNAQYVLTDSFHGTVFSIIHQKKFITLNRFDNGEQSRNSRIDSLCELLGLEERRYKNDILGEIEAPIDYKAVSDRLERLRIKSLDFLENALL